MTEAVSSNAEKVGDTLSESAEEAGSQLGGEIDSGVQRVKDATKSEEEKEAEKSTTEKITVAIPKCAKDAGSKLGWYDRFGCAKSEGYLQRRRWNEVNQVSDEHSDSNNLWLCNDIEYQFSKVLYQSTKQCFTGVEQVNTFPSTMQCFTSVEQVMMKTGNFRWLMNIRFITISIGH